MQTQSIHDLSSLDLPPHPRVFITGAGLQLCRSLTEEAVWARAALSRLLEAADRPCEWGDPVRPDHAMEMLNHALRQVLAAH